MKDQDNDSEKPKKFRKRKINQVIENKVSTQGDLININEPIILKIADLAEQNGYEIYIVGGYVRDSLLSRERKDFDFSVVGDSIEFANLVAKAFNTKAIIYERFRTALVPISNFNCEFVGTRKEVYEPSSRNPIVTVGTLEDDLKRRDFTVNALAISLNKSDFGNLIDLFGGLDDLRNKILRTPLDPEATYTDDPLRMMRAARFASQLDFELDPNSLEMIKSMSERISIISQERITDEFLKIIDSDVPSKGLGILFNTGLMKIIFPEMYETAGVDIVENSTKSYAHKDVFWHSLKVLDNISPNTNNRWLRFVALVHDIAKPRTKKFIEGTGWSFHGHEEFGARMMPKIFRKMKLPLEPLEYVQKLIRLHQRPMVLVDSQVTDSAVRRLAAHAGADLEDLFTLVRADITTKNPNLSEKYKRNYENVFNKVIEVQEKDRLREFQSPVRGETIMELCALQPSKPVGIIKSKIEDAILDGLIPNEFEAALQYLIENKDAWLDEIRASNPHLFRNL
jgi:tRNA nucleotidyltransferase/poly(A) polymerase